MRIVLLGGAPGIGKTTVGREILRIAGNCSVLVQWVDVDALWAHQPWRVDDVTVAMVHANLRAVTANAAEAQMQVLVITWVFQDTSMHDLLRPLAPAESTILTVQLTLSEQLWRRRFAADATRPDLIDAFFLNRYEQAQSTVADQIIDVGGLTVAAVAAEVCEAAGLLP